MEFVVTEIPKKKPEICLNMIIKDEAHIIVNTLNKILDKINIDYWVISDTGSTDKTKELIIDFFSKKNIRGELFEDKWENFGHNRTKALEHAYKKSNYVLIFDADDEICGDFVIPELKHDLYNFQFGSPNGISYIRPQLVNNNKRWKYVGVLHEFITCIESNHTSATITGNYYTVSGRTSNRNKYSNKYFKDALILEKAYEDALKNSDDIYNRYGFYCANSYYDCGKYEEAIKWFKTTLTNNNWEQEKYVSCLRIYNCYKKLNQKETGFYYLVKAFSYDKERVECLYELVLHYCVDGMNDVAYNYYNIVKSFYNDKYLSGNLIEKLFIDVGIAEFYLPYYMILVSYKVGDQETTIQMYRIIFTKKFLEKSKFFIGNMLFNLQFFIDYVKDDKVFLQLFQEYINFLISINYPVYDHEFMIKYENYGVKVPKISEPVFSLDNCLKSKNILLYSGYSPFKWNYTFSINNALGGSETAVTYLTKNFPKDYTIYVAGDVEEETVENIRYINFNNLNNLIKTTAFHSIIVSRYLNFYELYRNFSAYQTFIWAHDITLYAYGSDLSVEGILSKWASKITGCICQTEWHKSLFISSFPQLKDKITTINNGINVDLFNSKDLTKVNKITNRFIYTSCSERGLYKLVQLWPSILDNLPDAELVISSYNNFPKSDEDIKILEIITKIPSIKHMGKLNRPELYNLMATSEYWLYTSYFKETSCITSLELLASEVICLYYPVAGLVNTVGDYGIKISEGNEIDALLNLSIKKKIELKRKGKEYALSCSWQNRVIEWMKLMNIDNNNINIEESKSNIDNTKLDMWKNLNVEPYYNFPVSKYWFGNSELKNYLLNNIVLTKKYNILEIGSFEGCSSCFISDIVITNTLSTLTCVDPFVSDGSNETDHSTLKYKFYSNIKKTQNYNKINIVEKFSDDFYSTYNGSKFNFIYIDGEHSEKQILKDLDECFSLLDINGMIWCDDYNNKWKDIFDNWILLKNDYINVIHSGYQIAFIKTKNEVKRKGQENRHNECSEIPFLQNLSQTEKRMFDLYESLSMPEAHTNILKKISETFTPNVIYDIGASTLHWTKAAKNVWPNSQLCAFDAIEEAEKLYKSKNIKYNIGVISDQDNKIVKFYENKENPAGNSYYKEIGHPNSVNVYPENSYIERKAMTLETIVKRNNFLLPDLVKIDVQGAELDILNGGMNIINNAKYLIIELQNVEYNRGAPLENVTIDYLQSNGWEIVESKFSNNGPDADYLFINKNYRISNNNEDRAKIWGFHPGYFSYRPVIQYLENLTDKKTKVVISNDIDYINNLNPHEITFLLNLFTREPMAIDSIDKFNTKHISFLQLEPLNICYHLNKFVSFFNLHPHLKQCPIYDYSRSNIRILNKNGFTNCIYLPYKCSPDELIFLIKSNIKNKEYDFGYIYDWVSVNPTKKEISIGPPRRNKVIEFLINNGFTVNLIAGYGEDRDSELGKCKIILNIHGQINENPTPSPDECSNIFEHIRCDRLLKAGYTILSETNYDLDTEFINQYSNLKIINHKDFFNLDVINNIIYELNIKNIYDTLCLNENPFNYYLNPVDIHEHLPTLYKYATECNSILECGVRASVSSWALAYGLLNNNQETKKLILNDISPCDISNLLERTKNIKNLNITYQWVSDLDIILNENVELTFIDTWHVGGHLKKELKKFSKLTNKYIIMHDTTVFEFTNEVIREKLSEEQLINLSNIYGLSIEDIKMGLWPAIEDFLKNNPDWALHERYTNNNGLTILKKKPNKKIIDCFIFYNELDMLTYRLNILDDVVDYFVLVEATHTFVGKEKPSFYQENKELFKEFNHKIIHIIVDDFPHKYPNINIVNGEQWDNEIFQRNCIKRGLDKLMLNDNDIFTVTDVDEIPDPKLLQKIKATEVIIDANILEQDFYYYNLNCKINFKWHLTKIISYKNYKELGFSCEQIRQNMSFKIIPNAGWHLSYFGNEQFIKNKIENFCHQELNIVDFTDEKKISNRVKNKLDLYDRSNNTIVNVSIEDNDNLPHAYDKYLTKYLTK